MKIREPIPHWNNFTVPELKKILQHCRALERLGIAQDEEMIASIERDIILRGKKTSIPRRVPFASTPTKTKPQTPRQIDAQTSKKQPQEDYLLASNV